MNQFIGTTLAFALAFSCLTIQADEREEFEKILRQKEQEIDSLIKKLIKADDELNNAKQLEKVLRQKEQQIDSLTQKLSKAEAERDEAKRLRQVIEGVLKETQIEFSRRQKKYELGIEKLQERLAAGAQNFQTLRRQLQVRSETGKSKGNPPKLKSSKSVKDALGKKAEFELIEAPLTDIVEFWSIVYDIKVRVDKKSLAILGLNGNVELSLKAKDMTFKQCLEALLPQHGMAYKIDNNVLVIIANPKIIEKKARDLLDDSPF